VSPDAQSQGSIEADSVPAVDRLVCYRWMRLSRLVDDKLTALFRQGKLTGGVYSGRGQEAISVGSSLALGPEDIMAPMIRNLGSVLVRGFTLEEVFLNYLARGRGFTAGRDNGVHFGTVDGAGRFVIDARGGMVSPVSHLGSLVPVLAGMGLAARMQGRPLVALTYVGDGATSTGEFHEGMSFAAAQNAPLVVMIENNGYAYTTPTELQTAVTSLALRAKAYGVPARTIDGNDVVAVHAATEQAVQQARTGEGPVLIEAVTFRMAGHAQHDDQRYVPTELLQRWAERDPLDRLVRQLVAEDSGLADRLESIDRDLSRQVDEAAELALAALPPEPDSVTGGVTADD
jgi:TPP-dependent pyruvate/acetoin dehydrogenase alpha subunit